MVGFRGLDWIYDVTADGDALATRAGEFERLLASVPLVLTGAQPKTRARVSELPDGWRTRQTPSRVMRPAGRLEATTSPFLIADSPTRSARRTTTESDSDIHV
jgi:hypothetical protein